MGLADLLKRVIEALEKIISTCDGSKITSDECGRTLDEAEKIVREVMGELDDWESKAFGLFKRPQG